MAKSRKKPSKTAGHKGGQRRMETGNVKQRPAHKKDHNQRDSKQAGGITTTVANGFFLYGRNSIEAALKNPDRECIRLIGTEKALSDKKIRGLRPNLPTNMIDDIRRIAASVPEGAPHQGLLMEVRPLAGIHLDDLAPVEGQKNIILMLDQVTDPHNVGACMRSAAAFGARALITQDRNSPDESGTLARSAAGGLEALPWLAVPNLSHTLDKLKDMGYWHVGLDGNTDISIRDISLGDNIVIVMGSEGSGIRPLVRKHCDAIAKIPMSNKVESLNVSNAAAIALYELGNS